MFAIVSSAKNCLITRYGKKKNNKNAGVVDALRSSAITKYYIIGNSSALYVESGRSLLPIDDHPPPLDSTAITDYKIQAEPVHFVTR